jgi:membrane-associated phospholipid phosphatase
MLPWLRSRPPRTIEAPGVMAERASRLRRVNESVLDRASVQANTLPSGHVAGAVATALGVWPVSATAGAFLLVVAAMIAVAAFAGRYHYVVDCISGAVVAVIVAAAVAWVT